MSLNKPLTYGVLAGVILLLIYFVILSVANSFNHVIEQFLTLWYWILLLTVGFGLQVGLYVYSKEAIKKKKECQSLIDEEDESKVAVASIGATGSMSATSMVACCAHHLVDVLPILGLSAAALFLAKYQIFFMVIGVVSNIIGINMMLYIITKHKLYSNKSKFFKSVAKINLRKMLYLNYIVGVVVILITLMLIMK